MKKEQQKKKLEVVNKITSKSKLTEKDAIQIGNRLKKDMFKKFKASSEEFDKMLKKTHELAKKHKLTEKDMWEAIRKARKNETK